MLTVTVRAVGCVRVRPTVSTNPDAVPVYIREEA
jgi:hypothetical protein